MSQRRSLEISKPPCARVFCLKFIDNLPKGYLGRLPKLPSKVNRKAQIAVLGNGVCQHRWSWCIRHEGVKTATFVLLSPRNTMLKVPVNQVQAVALPRMWMSKSTTEYGTLTRQAWQMLKPQFGGCNPSPLEIILSLPTPHKARTLLPEHSRPVKE